jgi:hypothetical protein
MLVGRAPRRARSAERLRESRGKQALYVRDPSWRSSRRDSAVHRSRTARAGRFTHDESDVTGRPDSISNVNCTAPHRDRGGPSSRLAFCRRRSSRRRPRRGGGSSAKSRSTRSRRVRPARYARNDVTEEQVRTAEIWLWPPPGVATRDDRHRCARGGLCREAVRGSERVRFRGTIIIDEAWASDAKPATSRRRRSRRSARSGAFRRRSFRRKAAFSRFAST